MAPKRRTTRLNPSATPTPVTDTHTTTSVTNAQIQAMINEGVTAALAARDATRNGDDSHTSGTGARRPVQVARECTYPDFLKCQPLNFKGTEGVVVRALRELLDSLSESDIQIPLEEIRVNDKVYFIEEPVEIVDRQIKKLKRSWIPIVKVRWDSRRGAEFTWEREDQFKAKYPHLFALVHQSSPVEL
ncbi:hypothetical protein Tco_0958915 [Tanacetum coccineum]